MFRSLHLPGCLLATLPLAGWAQEPADAAPTPAAEIATVTPVEPPDEPTGYFISRLAQVETFATGLHELTALEKANLENLIAYEVSAARAGGVTGFAKAFSARRTPAELDATGIDRLSDEQRQRLDQHIAGFIADQPVPYVFRGERVGPGSTDSGRDNDQFSGQGPKLEIHGSVTLEVGGGSGTSYYGGSATTVISDPQGRFNAVISVGSMKGKTSGYDVRRSSANPR